MLKMTATLLLTPILIMAGNGEKPVIAAEEAAEQRIEAAVEQIRSDWNSGEISLVPPVHAAQYPAVSARTIAMVAPY